MTARPSAMTFQHAIPYSRNKPLRVLKARWCGFDPIKNRHQKSCFLSPQSFSKQKRDMPHEKKCAIDSPSSKEPLFTRSGTFPLPSSWTAISRADSLPCCIPLVKILTRDFLRRIFPMRPLCFFCLSHQYVSFPRLDAVHKHFRAWI